MYEVKNFENLLGMKGFSDTLLKNHFRLYQGYVTNTNKVVELLKTYKPGTPEFAELSRRFGWEFNGMRLHELYFGNLKKGGSKMKQDKNSEFYKQCEKSFASHESWKEDFVGKASMRGIGWVIFCKDPETNKLFNVWINEHDVGHLSGAIPLLVLDVFEHAFMVDYGLNKADYINAFFENIDWEAVEKRFK